MKKILLTLIMIFQPILTQATTINRFAALRRFPTVFQAAFVTSQNVAKHLFKIMQKGNKVGYINEKGLTQVAHAEQTAYNMRKAIGCKDKDLYCPQTIEPVLAALFHDIGHLCASDNAPQMGYDGVCDHELIGARFLLNHGFSKSVTRLIASHANAKRYLVATDQKYLKGLSPASQRTLKFQGGPMSKEECEEFEASADFALKLALIKADDAAKNPHAKVPSLKTYQRPLEMYLFHQFFNDLSLLNLEAIQTIGTKF